MFKTATDIMLFIVAVVAVLTGFYKGYTFLHKKWKSCRDKKNGFFSGYWNNEGNIIKHRPTHYIDLTLNCAGKNLRGSFNLRKSEDESGWVKVTLVGKRRSHSAKCRITYEKNGEVLSHGEVVLTKDKAGKSGWKLVNGTRDFFPKGAILNRSLPVLG